MGALTWPLAGPLAGVVVGDGGLRPPENYTFLRVRPSGETDYGYLVVRPAGRTDYGRLAVKEPTE